MARVSCDFESRSRRRLGKKHKDNRGLANYFACPDFRPLLLRYQIDDGPINGWRWGQPCPADLAAAIAAGAEIHAYNAQFEMLAFEWLAENCGWPAIPDDRYVDTAAAVAALGLPRSLEQAAAVLGLDEQKDEEGGDLIRFFCVPRRDGLFNEPQDFPEKFDRFDAYCEQDVRTERAVAERVPPLSPYERQVWQMYVEINRRGLRIDVQSATGVKAIVAAEVRRLDENMRTVTAGEIATCSQAKKILEWINRRWPEGGMDGLNKKAIAKVDYREDMPVDVRAVLNYRKEAAKTSVAKIDAMLRFASDDGRARFTSIYHGASTGRITSVNVNFANMTRASKQWEKARLDVRAIHEAFREQKIEALPEWKGGAMQLVSDAVRSFVWAAPGHMLMQADFSAIEALVAAWVAGETWKIDFFRQVLQDPKTPDIYRQTASRMTGLSTDVITKDHPFRQSLGKTSELAFGFSGGVAAYHEFCEMYGINVVELYGPISETATDANKAKAERRYARCAMRGEHRANILPHDGWVACELAKLAWRQANPAISASWALLEDAMRDAVQSPGEVFSTMGISYVVGHGFLWCRLPSGRMLAYATPKLRDCVWIRRVEADGTLAEDAEPMDAAEAYVLVAKGLGQIDSPAKPRVTAAGRDGHLWKRYAVTGGLAFENCIQGTARDILVDLMLRLRAKGFNIIMDVYDEVVCEVPTGEIHRQTEMLQEMRKLPQWCSDMPLGAAGSVAKRYFK